MNRSAVVNVAVGVIGAVLVSVVSPPGENVVRFGFLRFDPGLALVAGFVFLAVWGFVTSLDEVGAIGDRLEATGVDRTTATLVLAASLAGGAMAYVQTDLTGASLVATVLASTVSAMLVATGAVLVLRRFGWFPEGLGRQ